MPLPDALRIGTVECPLANQMAFSPTSQVFLLFLAHNVCNSTSCIPQKVHQSDSGLLNGISQMMHFFNGLSATVQVEVLSIIGRRACNALERVDRNSNSAQRSL